MKIPKAEVDERILRAAEECFMQRGFGEVTTEELAKLAGISKKTLYAQVPSKKELLRLVVMRNLVEIENALAGILDRTELGAVEKIRLTYNEVSQRVIHKLGRLLLKDLYRSAPEIWETIDAFRRDKIARHFIILTREAKREGHLRQDLDEQLLILILLTLMNHLLTPQIMAELPYTASQVVDTVFRTLFEGGLTEEGRRLFKGKDHAEKE